jgi:hypothetical protein
MGRAYDFAFRPVVGEPGTGFGGPCDTRPHRVALFSATTDPASATAVWQSFGLCDEHEEQLRRIDRARRAPPGAASRFRPAGDR